MLCFFLCCYPNYNVQNQTGTEDVTFQSCNQIQDIKLKLAQSSVTVQGGHVCYVTHQVPQCMSPPDVVCDVKSLSVSPYWFQSRTPIPSVSLRTVFSEVRQVGQCLSSLDSVYDVKWLCSVSLPTCFS